MTKIDEVIEDLTSMQKQIIQAAIDPSAIILFNIKGMIQVVHEDKPYDFMEMGHEDIETLKEKGLIDTVRGMRESHLLQGQEYRLSKLGREVAKRLSSNKN